MNIDKKIELEQNLKIALNEENFIKANDILKILSVNFPKNYSYRINLAATYRKIGNPIESFNEYKEAEKLNNKDYILYFNLGNLLKDDFNNKNEAIISYLECLKLNPGYIDCWSNLGIVYLEIDKFDLAIKVCDKILSINPNHYEGNYMKGFSLLSMNSAKNGKIFIEKALQIEYNIGALRALAEINHMLGNKNEAVKLSAESEGAFVL